MSNNAISVEGVGKSFRLHRSGTRTVKSMALDILRRPGSGRKDFWALKDVSFKVPCGETLGIIGANGAGKSTLLSLLAGTKVPTTGRIEAKGTISSLLELGAGFHPDLTGRENVFLCGAIMGLTRRQMKERFDAIVSFAGLDEFIDQPVKHYSSGMYVRLGFAVAVEVDPDILLIDEVLAVGDVEFQRKCIDKMKAFREQGKTMLIISHDLGTIQRISDRILFLDEGTVQGIGDPDSVVSNYKSMARSKSVGGLDRVWGTGEVSLERVEFLAGDGSPTDTFSSGSGLLAKIFYKANMRVEDPVFGFSLADSEGRLIYGNNTQIEKFAIPSIEGEGTITLHLGELPMAAGTYLFSFSVHSADHRTNYHRLDNCFPIAVESTSSFEGVCFIPSRWEMGGTTSDKGEDNGPA
ncbi:MAG: ABC transporter ATP-binding protein [Kiritimatiellia bacterium]|nr:ABC transporter ATP-binding protein [Kiritimatiellia bacterium]MDP6849004.1 ABC transporter ATP-binding protein [Kiritimatiellia bacterium]